MQLHAVFFIHILIPGDSFSSTESVMTTTTPVSRSELNIRSTSSWEEASCGRLTMMRKFSHIKSVKIYRIDLPRLSISRQPSRTSGIIKENLSSIKKVSTTFFATVFPVRRNVIPKFAYCRASTSMTPSSIAPAPLFRSRHFVISETWDAHVIYKYVLRLFLKWSLVQLKIRIKGN